MVRLSILLALATHTFTAVALFKKPPKYDGSNLAAACIQCNQICSPATHVYRQDVCDTLCNEGKVPHMENKAAGVICLNEVQRQYLEKAYFPEVDWSQRENWTHKSFWARFQAEYPGVLT